MPPSFVNNDISLAQDYVSLGNNLQDNKANKCRNKQIPCCMCITFLKCLERFFEDDHLSSPDMATKACCFLRNLRGLHPDLPLPENVRVVLGRGPKTKVKDSRCSREQIALSANYSQFRVSVEQIGANSSAVNGKEIGRGKTVEARNGDVIRLLAEGIPEHELKLFFQPPPPVAEKEKDVGVVEERKRKRGHTDNSAVSPATKRPRRTMEGLDLTLKESVISKKSAAGFLWEETANGQVYVMTSEKCDPREKIAAFDMDGTLITTQSGLVFPKDSNDWKILLPEVPGKLKQLHADGFKIVVLTNQAGIAKGKLRVEDFRNKVERIAQKLNVPLQLFCCAGDGGMFRKPRIGVWSLLAEKKNGGVAIDMGRSFYCGDAAGRDKDWLQGRKKDFSCSDRLFALNIGLRFQTPEELFLGQKPTDKFHLPEYDPKSAKSDCNLLEPEGSVLIAKSQEVVMFVGMQGSGKSFLASTIFEPARYVLGSNDLSGGRDKTLKILSQALTEGKSVVLDNTHADRETRRKFLEVIKKHPGVPCRCFVMKTTPQQARHNNIFRELIDAEHAKIKEALFNTFKSRYEEPKMDEGFSAIVLVNFVPKFKDENEEKLYRMYLQEK